jgi:hypothetical protein
MLTIPGHKGNEIKIKTHWDSSSLLLELLP